MKAMQLFTGHNIASSRFVASSIQTLFNIDTDRTKQILNDYFDLF